MGYCHTYKSCINDEVFICDSLNFLSDISGPHCDDKCLQLIPYLYTPRYCRCENLLIAKLKSWVSDHKGLDTIGEQAQALTSVRVPRYRLWQGLTRRDLSVVCDHDRVGHQRTIPATEAMTTITSWILGTLQEKKTHFTHTCLLSIITELNLKDINYCNILLFFWSFSHANIKTKNLKDLNNLQIN